MRWSMVPVSICAHVIVGLVAVIVPLAAEDDWPEPAPVRSLVVTMKAVPVPPAVGPPAAVRPAAAAVEVRMPSQLEPEHETPPAPATSTATAVEGGVGPVEAGISGGVGAALSMPPPPPPPVAQPTAPIRPGGAIREPKKTLDVAPVYPTMAVTARIEGRVILEAVINERGGVERVRVLRSVPFLDAAAIDAVKQWRYTPTLLNGTPVPVLMTITINFTLRN